MVAVEDVRSLWNVGSIFRTADGAGFDGLFLCGITAAPPRKEISKTSLGAEDSVPWEYCPEPLSLLRHLKSLGVLTLALECTHDSRLLPELLRCGAFKVPLCLIIGNEVTGVSPQSLSLCDFVAHLPMRGIKQSLNVAVAFGVAAYMLAESMNTCS